MEDTYKWQEGILEEIEFWKKYIATEGLNWPDYYRRKLDPKSELLPLVESEVVRADQPIEILDVGCGPASYMGHISPSGKKVVCVFSDALAEEYKQLWSEAGISPPHEIRAVDAESLSSAFASSRFAIVFARNTMDHMHNPLEALKQMLHVTRPGGAVILLHYAREGSKERFSGLHQWDLYVEGGSYFLADSKGRVIDLKKAVADVAVLEELLPENGCPGDDPALQKVVFRKL